PTEEEVQQLKQLVAETFRFKDMGPAHHYFGVRLIRDGHSISLLQDGFIRKLLQRFGMSDCNPVATPMTTEPLRKFDGTPDPEILKEYPEITGSLTWLASRSRPDIGLAVSKLSRYVSNPGPQHLTAARRVLRYLIGTIIYGIRFSASDSLDLKLYADAAFVVDLDTYFLTAGYWLLAADGSIF